MLNIAKQRESESYLIVGYRQAPENKYTSIQNKSLKYSKYLWKEAQVIFPVASSASNE